MISRIIFLLLFLFLTYFVSGHSSSKTPPLPLSSLPNRAVDRRTGAYGGGIRNADIIKNHRYPTLVFKSVVSQGMHLNFTVTCPDKNLTDKSKSFTIRQCVGYFAPMHNMPYYSVCSMNISITINTSSNSDGGIGSIGSSGGGGVGSGSIASKSYASAGNGTGVVNVKIDTAGRNDSVLKSPVTGVDGLKYEYYVVFVTQHTVPSSAPTLCHTGGFSIRSINSTHMTVVINFKAVPPSKLNGFFRSYRAFVIEEDRSLHKFQNKHSPESTDEGESVFESAVDQTGVANDDIESNVAEDGNAERSDDSAGVEGGNDYESDVDDDAVKRELEDKSQLAGDAVIEAVNPIKDGDNKTDYSKGIDDDDGDDGDADGGDLANVSDADLSPHYLLHQVGFNASNSKQKLPKPPKHNGTPHLHKGIGEGDNSRNIVTTSIPPPLSTTLASSGNQAAADSQSNSAKPMNVWHDIRMNSCFSLDLKSGVPHKVAIDVASSVGYNESQRLDLINLPSYKEYLELPAIKNFTVIHLPNSSVLLWKLHRHGTHGKDFGNSIADDGDGKVHYDDDNDGDEDGGGDDGLTFTIFTCPRMYFDWRLYTCSVG
ncbi:hypothetical protein HELRODRAFT_184053 [Helobdella robusta]|uniref:CUB domain-containing protein n=1 Tax=Helobdella robusta TaxID=6412 RepID=T1FKH7_HELRO|nr:hypothetical protein HELRODRAFT_184053 [Helobdella robusta]ESO08677.1 hypothetical protein HELRODRAFT_184053 [Helobdella robusta]